MLGLDTSCSHGRMADAVIRKSYGAFSHVVLDLPQVAATKFITELGAKHTEQMKLCLPLIVPVLSGAVADSKLQVKVLLLGIVQVNNDCICLPETYTNKQPCLGLMLQEASINALRATCKTVGNKDVDPFIPVLIDSIAKPSEVAECVHKLSATTFVQVYYTILTIQCVCPFPVLWGLP